MPGAYVSKFGLLGYIFLLFKRQKYQNLIEIFYLSLIGLVCFVQVKEWH